MDGHNQEQYIDTAVRAVQNKRQVPEIDFTLHTMEDGMQVNTQDRVCKGMWTVEKYARKDEWATHGIHKPSLLRLTQHFGRRASARLQRAHRRATRVAPRSNKAEPTIPEATSIP